LQFKGSSNIEKTQINLPGLNEKRKLREMPLGLASFLFCVTGREDSCWDEWHPQKLD